MSKIKDIVPPQAVEETERDFNFEVIRPQPMRVTGHVTTGAGASLEEDNAWIGSNIFQKSINLFGQRLLNVGTPVEDTDGANKGYVRDQVDTMVSLTTNQTINGVKTWNATQNINHLAGARYIDYTGDLDLNSKNTSGANYINIIKTYKGSGYKHYGGFQFKRSSNGVLTSIGSIVMNDQDKMIISGLANPTANDNAANKEYVDGQVGTKQNTLTAGSGIAISSDNVISTTEGGGGGSSYVLLLSPNQTAFGTLTTKQIFNLPANTSTYQQFKVLVEGTGQEYTTLDFMIDNRVYGQPNTGKHLAAYSNGKKLQLIIPSSSGVTREIWIYTDFKVLKIYGITGSLL